MCSLLGLVPVLQGTHGVRTFAITLTLTLTPIPTPDSILQTSIPFFNEGEEIEGEVKRKKERKAVEGRERKRRGNEINLWERRAREKASHVKLKRILNIHVSDLRLTGDRSLIRTGSL